MREWRFVPYQCFDGATNMAVDEAILETHLAGKSPPTVRLYGWSPPAISIGYAQKLAPEVIARMQATGLDVVRRPTGGRAVLHAQELTYSFVGTSINEADDRGFLPKSIVAAYKIICQALIEALSELGVRAELGAADVPYRQMQDCFLATTTADLHHQGKKMVGSAQCRRGNGVLQHGSILLEQDQYAMDQLLNGADITLDKHSDRHANLFAVTGRKVSIQEMSDAIRHGFERVFECTLRTGTLSQNELDLAAELREKFVVKTIAIG